MGDKSRIEWTDATWNPLSGCAKVSAGCRNCYAMRVAHRLAQHPNPKISGAYEGLTVERSSGPEWTGDVRPLPERLDQPLRWQRPRRVFVNSLSDLFHEDVSPEFISAVWGVMAVASAHTFQVLTKRPRRAREVLSNLAWRDGDRAARCADDAYGVVRIQPRRFAAAQADPPPWPLPNVWLGTSVEDDRVIDRVDELRRTRAAVRFLSCEPLLGPLPDLDLDGIDWVIVGGESGPGARPMDPVWVRDIRDQCQRAGVAFFFKQWGGVQKKKTGRILDGRTWDEMPPGVGEVAA